MRKIALPLFAFLIVFNANAQFDSNKSKSQKVTLKPQFEFTLPPNLYVEMDFSDDNGNGIIEAEEKAKLILNITNKGDGPAQGLKVKLTSDTQDSEFKIGDEKYIRQIPLV